MAHALAQPGQAVRYADLLHAPRMRDKLEALRLSLRASLPGGAAALDAEDAAILDDPAFGMLWLQQARRLAERASSTAVEVDASQKRTLKTPTRDLGLCRERLRELIRNRDEE